MPELGELLASADRRIEAKDRKIIEMEATIRQIEAEELKQRNRALTAERELASLQKQHEYLVDEAKGNGPLAARCLRAEAEVERLRIIEAAWDTFDGGQSQWERLRAIEKAAAAVVKAQDVSVANAHAGRPDLQPIWDATADLRTALTNPAAVEAEQPNYQYAVIDVETGEPCLFYEEFDALRHDIEWPAPDGSIRRRTVGEWERMTLSAGGDSDADR